MDSSAVSVLGGLCVCCQGQGGSLPGFSVLVWGQTEFLFADAGPSLTADPPCLKLRRSIDIAV